MSGHLVAVIVKVFFNWQIISFLVSINCKEYDIVLNQVYFVLLCLHYGKGKGVLWFLWISKQSINDIYIDNTDKTKELQAISLISIFRHEA